MTTATEITLCDVGPRDGLQNDAVVLDPAVRAELCRRLIGAGLRHVEAASFVNPARVPPMAGAEEVIAGIGPVVCSAVVSALALNLRGVQRALDTVPAVREIHVAYPLTDAFGMRNQGMTVEHGAEAAAAMIAAGHEGGAQVTATLSVAFGCPFEGHVDPGLVADHAARMAAAGADALMLADTVGVGVPAQVRRLMPDALAAMNGRPVGLHLHNTRNTGYANALAGLEHGATVFDASVGGLGGCPFAPRATGNIATEDLVYMLDGEGVETGVDAEALIGVSHWLGGVLGRELPGLLARADLPGAVGTGG